MKGKLINVGEKEQKVNGKYIYFERNVRRRKGQKDTTQL